jgi:16S rRNA (adenine1518-N6/adenine1519-N6)-dimethyltransferase
MDSDGLEIRFKKRLGQNFLTDTNLLRAIVTDAGIGKDDLVVEIGAGAGALTRELSRCAKAVRAYEIDRDLEPALRRSFDGARIEIRGGKKSPGSADSGKPEACFESADGGKGAENERKAFRGENVTLVFGDFLKLFPGDSKALAPGYKAVANLPYYITAPVLFALIENENPPESVTVMVQNEVALRLQARPGTPEYGALTAACALYGTAEKTRAVPPSMFKPRPNVDSAVVRIVRSGSFSPLERAMAARVIRAAFAMRRKTLENNLSAAFALPKVLSASLIASAGLSPSARGETLSAEQFVRLGAVLRDTVRGNAGEGRK